MKDVSGSSTINHLYSEGRRVVEVLAIPTQHAFRTQSGGSESTAKFMFQPLQRLAEICIPGQASWQFAADDQVINTSE
jgi:hypothetical protein